MHARIDQLLSLRDGEPVDVSVREHVQQCAACLAESVRLTQTRSRLLSLSTLDPPQIDWAQIEARATRRPEPKRRVWSIAAALVACVVGAIAFVGSHSERGDVDELALTRSPSFDALNEGVERLMAESRELEEVLAHLPQRPQLERVSTAATVDSIEQRIQWLDWQLAYQADDGLDARQAKRLWSERVELMDSLVKVRYAQSTPMAF